MQIRPIGEDAEQLAKAFAHESFVDLSRLAQWNEQQFPGREAWVAWQDSDCLGLVVIDSMPGAAVELTLAVVQDRQRQGIGTTLLDFVADRCRCQQKKRICAVIDRRNEVALAFFTAAGFQSEPTQLADHVRLFLRVESSPDQRNVPE